MRKSRAHLNLLTFEIKSRTLIFAHADETRCNFVVLLFFSFFSISMLLQWNDKNVARKLKAFNFFLLFCSTTTLKCISFWLNQRWNWEKKKIFMLYIVLVWTCLQCRMLIFRANAFSIHTIAIVVHRCCELHAKKNFVSAISRHVCCLFLFGFFYSRPAILLLLLFSFHKTLPFFFLSVFAVLFCLRIVFSTSNWYYTRKFVKKKRISFVLRIFAIACLVVFLPRFCLVN